MYELVYFASVIGCLVEFLVLFERNQRQAEKQNLLMILVGVFCAIPVINTIIALLVGFVIYATWDSSTDDLQVKDD